MAASSFVRPVLLLIAVSLTANAHKIPPFQSDLAKQVATDPVAHEHLKNIVLSGPQPRLKGLGAPGYTCPASLMMGSATVPTNAHQVRPADIKVVAALGDSLTAANGAGASTVIGLELQYRGLAFSIGMDMDLDQHITIPNILRKYNPSVFGASINIGTVNNWNSAKLNAGVPGAQSSDLIAQARDLVSKILAHTEVNVANDWKLINIFIGGNDMCAYCHDAANDPNAPHNAAHYRDNIRAAIQFLADRLPRTIVNLVGMFNMNMLRVVDHGQLICQGLHLFECDCEVNSGFTNEIIGNASLAYMMAEQELQDQGVFDVNGKEDFTLVIQPFFEDITIPPTLPNGTVDLSYFAPDCFHFSQFGHATVAKAMWKNMLQPVGQKDRWADLQDLTSPLACPDPVCPFIRTTKNSVTCQLTEARK